MMSKWHCFVCSSNFETKHSLVDHLKCEMEKFEWEYDQYDTAQQQLYELTGDTE